MFFSASTLRRVDADLTGVETRLLAVLERGASAALAEGRAELVVTTQREFWGLPAQQEQGDRMLGLLPRAQGAARVGVLDGQATGQYDSWHLFVGDGPHFEFWESSEADYEQTERIVRAVVQGKCRHWSSREDMRGLLRPWRRRGYWVHHAEVALEDEVLHASYEGAGVVPDEGEPRAFQAAPY